MMLSLNLCVDADNFELFKQGSEWSNLFSIEIYKIQNVKSNCSKMDGRSIEIISEKVGCFSEKSSLFSKGSLSYSYYTVHCTYFIPHYSIVKSLMEFLKATPTDPNPPKTQ